MPAHVDEPFELIFMPEPEVSRSEEEIELGKADCDVVFHDGSTIDLGAAIADTLALASIHSREAPAPTPRSRKLEC